MSDVDIWMADRMEQELRGMAEGILTSLPDPRLVLVVICLFALLIIAGLRHRGEAA